MKLVYLASLELNKLENKTICFQSNTWNSSVQINQFFSPAKKKFLTALELIIWNYLELIDRSRSVKHIIT